MYGIVNKAIQELVTEHYGEETWERVRNKSQVAISSFLSTAQYPDEITFQLALAAAEELKASLRQVLLSFGEFWILNTGKKHYGQLMEAGGVSFPDFLVNLPSFHSRVMLYYPNISPPEFKVRRIGLHEIDLYYYSTRNGLTDFVEGLIHGIGKMFNISIQIDLVESKTQNNEYDRFRILF